MAQVERARPNPNTGEQLEIVESKWRTSTWLPGCIRVNSKGIEGSSGHKTKLERIKTWLGLGPGKAELTQKNPRKRKEKRDHSLQYNQDNDHESIPQEQVTGKSLRPLSDNFRHAEVKAEGHAS